MSEGEESNEVRVLDNGAVVIPAIQTTGNALGQVRLLSFGGDRSR